jgi:hypothetical protein
MPKYYSILDNGVSPMASKKSGYNKSGGKKNDPNRAKFVDKYVKQNTKSADRPATKKQARNAYYLTSVDDKKGTRGAKSTGAKAKTPAGSMMRTRADGNKPGSPAGRKSGIGQAGPNMRAGVGKKATYPGKSAGMAGASKEKRVAGPRVRGMDDAGPVVRAGVGKKQSAKKPKSSMMKKAASASRKKEKSKSMMRPAPKATGARDLNRRTY